jgi:hypothetical protein
MNEEQRRIWNYLKENAIGIDRAIHVSKIAQDLGFQPKGTNNDDVRNHVTSLVMKENLPVGTYEKGVFLITNDVEKEIAAKYVERKTKADAIRSANLYIPEE